MKNLLSTVAVLCLLTAPAFAQQPRISNGQVQPLAVSGSLDRTLSDLAARGGDPMWIGYAVPSANPESNMCCWSDGGSTTCNLEPGASNAVNMTRGTTTNTDPIRLESGDVFFVLYRIEQKQVTRIRMFSEECRIDAGGRVVQWLTGVKPRKVWRCLRHTPPRPIASRPTRRFRPSPCTPSQRRSTR